MGERRKAAVDLGVRYLLTLISLRRFSAKRVPCASWGGTVLGSESRLLRVPVVDVSRLCPIFFDCTSSATMAGSAGALVSSALDEVETIAAPEEITPAIQAAIHTLDR